MDDPWDWDVDTVVRELCTPDERPWHSSTRLVKLPPLNQLEDSLREHEIDGEVLLTYDQTELCVELGIKILKHRSTFKTAIRYFQSQSKQYRVFQNQKASEFEDGGEDLENKAQRLDDTQRKSVVDIGTSNPNFEAPGETPSPKVDIPSSIRPHPDSSSTAIESAPKKRRIAPALLTTELNPDRNRNIATEADTVRFSSKLLVENIHRKSVSDDSNIIRDNAYLGSKSITRFDIIHFDHSRPTNPDTDLITGEDKQINIVSSVKLIPGRQLQTHRLMKRRLLGKTIRRRTRFSKPDIVWGMTNPDDDEVLPVYGDSDDDAEYDSDTWKEIEAEENEKSPNASSKGLTVDDINLTFDRVIEQMASDWKTIKLPKYAGKSHLFWRDGRRFGLKDAMDRARRELSALENRIAKWKETVLKNEYRSEKELEQSLSPFEPSVFDREHRLWLIDVLSSPTEPKPLKTNRARQPATLKQQPQLEHDEEVLTSDSEDGLWNFIVDDELDHPMVTEDDYISNANEESHVALGEDPNNDTDYSADDIVRPDIILPDRSQAGSQTSLQTPIKSTQSTIIDLTSIPDAPRYAIHSKSGKSSAHTANGAKSSSLLMDIKDLAPDEHAVARELITLDQIFINIIFSITRNYRPEDIWSDLVLPEIDKGCPKAPFNSHLKKEGFIAYTFIRFFDTYQDGTSYRLGRYKNLDNEGKTRLRELYTLNPEEWGKFVGFLKRLSDRFEWTETKMSQPNSGISSARTDGIDAENTPSTESHSDAMDVDTGSDEKKPSRIDKKKKKRRQKEVVRNREAAMVRELDHAGAAERESRAKLLRERLITEGSMALGSQQDSIIVNESKADDQGFIYIHDKIATQIKDHQITGVRFMWNQLIVAKKRQGCLLAHTMGLGKTMQVITLLVTIGQASLSPDPTVSSQVPEELRDSRTLVLCPAALVNNWLDEMLRWLPENHGLGEIHKIDAPLTPEQRNRLIRSWDTHGGILIVGYDLFITFVENQDTKDTFLQRPNIVIADEAHLMKNPKSKTHIAAANFRTLSRVALTGSPLANNVEEYYSMINWIAPNYLSDIREFRARYANPIKEGLHADSTASDRRRALRMLRVLKTEVAPKVSRITIAVLKHDIPLKKEFVITVPLTLIQRQAYEMFIQYHSNDNPDSNGVPAFAIHDLNLICASPSIFLEKLKGIKKTGKAPIEEGKVTLPQQLVSDEMALLLSAERGAKDDFTLSWKIPILLEILDQCKKLGDRVLLFSHSRVTLDYLDRILRMKKIIFVRLDGNTAVGNRQGLVKRFNDGNVDIFLISTKAGALGLNITGANRVVIFDAQFNPQNEQQAVGRAYRIGQRKPVFVYRFVCGGTCEQELLHQAIWKMQLASRVVDKKNPLHRAQRFSGAWAMPKEPEQKDLNPMLEKDTVLKALLSQQRYRDGIRAVEMMDTFEEEAIEDAELLDEDLALSDQMIRDNEARRSGKPLPPHLSGGIMTTDWSSFVPSSQPPSAQPPTASQLLRQPVFPRPLGASQTLQLPPSALNNAQIASPYDQQSRLPSNLAPMRLPGAEIHYRPSDDPQHLQTVLHRLSAAPNHEDGEQSDQKKSHRLNDQEALRAVFERRKLKTQQKEDEVAVQAVMEHRKSKTPSSQSSGTGSVSKERLPNWAKDVVRQAQIKAPSSSIPPARSPSVPSRPPSQTPFK